MFTHNTDDNKVDEEMLYSLRLWYPNNKIIKFAEPCVLYLSTIRSHRDIIKKEKNRQGNQTA